MSSSIADTTKGGGRVPRRFRVGDWTADATSNELSRDGRRRRVEPKVMRVLGLLSARAPEVVARDELLDDVWHGTVVGDEALTQSIIKLRRALGDDARAPTYVETIPKGGYRLIAPVDMGLVDTGDVPVVAAMPATTHAASPWTGAHTRSTLAAASAAVFLLLASGPSTPTRQGAAVVSRPATATRTASAGPAHAAFVRAQALFLARQPDDIARSRRLYRESIERDPAFARAYAGLAMTYAIEPRLRDDTERSHAYERALEIARTARAIDPSSPDAYWALGFVFAQQARHREAMAALSHALALAPDFADAYALLGGVETYVGRPAQAITLLRKALQLNPNAGYLYLLLLGRAYFFAHDAAQASIYLRAAALRNPADVETHVYLAALAVASGDLQAAAWEADEIRSLDRRFSLARWMETYPMTDATQRRRLSGLLAPAGL
jgi:DNA-binding winged helix-turn-helix (wHTH) protein/tetratricopeptide (TPR) repeat protein